MCVSLFSKSFLIKLLVQASLEYCIMDNIYKKHFFTGALKNLLKFLKQFQKKIHAEAAVLRCLQDRCPEKIRKLHKETPVLESLFKKVSRNKETPTQVFSCEFCEAFKNTFFTEHLWWSWSFSFKLFYVQEFNEFLSNSMEFLHANSKNYLGYLHFFFIHFLYNLFFLLMKILNTSA